ncbi:MAG: hypothetical protein Q6373_005005 [Candidatus Sigynarchaeota archaeon]
MAAIELLVRALVLVLIYLIFAFTLLCVLLIFLVTIPIFAFVSHVLGVEPPIIETTRITLNTDSGFVIFEYGINSKDIDFLDLNIPNIYIRTLTDTTNSEFQLNFFALIPNSSLMASSTPATAMESALVKTSTQSAYKPDEDVSILNEMFRIGFFAAFGITGGAMAICGVLVNFFHADIPKKVIVTLIVIAGYVAAFLGIVIYIASVLRELHATQNLVDIHNFIHGVGLGLFIIFLLNLYILPRIGSLAGAGWDIASSIASVLSLIFTGIPFFVDEPEAWTLIFGMVLDFAAYIFGVVAIATIVDENSRNLCKFIWVFIPLVVGLILLPVHQQIMETIADEWS